MTFGALNATSYTVNSDSQITAIAPPHAAGAGNVVVHAPGGDSAAAAFTYTAVPAPTVTNVNPAGGPLAGGTV